MRQWIQKLKEQKEAVLLHSKEIDEDIELMYELADKFGYEFKGLDGNHHVFVKKENRVNWWYPTYPFPITYPYSPAEPVITWTSSSGHTSNNMKIGDQT